MDNETSVGISVEVLEELEFIQSCQAEAIGLARQLHESINVCDLECSLIPLVKAEIEAEYAAIGRDEKRATERLNELLRMKRRLIAFIEAGHCFIEDVEALTGAKIERTPLSNLASRLARRHQERASEHVEPTEQVDQMSFKNYSNIGAQIPKPVCSGGNGEQQKTSGATCYRAFDESAECPEGRWAKPPEGRWVKPIVIPSPPWRRQPGESE
jgi:hypothetical protein